MRTLAVALALVLGAAAGCGGEDEGSAVDVETVAVDDFEPYQCQTVIQGSAQLRAAVEENDPELLVHLIQLGQFFDTSGGALPEALRDDFETVLEPQDAFWDAVSRGGAPTRQVLQPVLDDIDQPEFLAAATRINTWANEDC